MPTQTLQIIGSYGLELDLAVNEIVRDFGDGFDQTVFVGNTAGLRRYRLKYEFLPDSTSDLSVTDPEDSTVKSYARYLYDFFLRRKVDGAAFQITCPLKGDTVLVKFTDKVLTLQLFTYKLYSSGLALRQYRSA